MEERGGPKLLRLSDFSGKIRHCPQDWKFQPKNPVPVPTYAWSKREQRHTLSDLKQIFGAGACVARY